jgi:16S rRNA processing protein RimM
VNPDNSQIEIFPELIPIGYVQKTIGFIGQLLIQCDTALLNKDKYPKFLWFLQYGKPVPFKVEKLQAEANNKFKLNIEDITSGEEASSFKNLTCFVEAKICDDYFAAVETYDYLLGYTVIDNHAGILGKVEDVLENDNGHDNLVVLKDSQEIMIPFVDAIVTNINESEQKIQVELPEGLLDLYLK